MDVDSPWELLRGVPLAEVLPLRHRNLRRGRPLESARFLEDALPGTRHYLIRDGGRGVACATICPDPRGPWKLRLRGMAVDPAWRRRGLGTLLVRALQEDAAASHCGIWCNARMVAVPLYASCGFRGNGEDFEIEGIGPHRRMVWMPER